MSGRAAVSVLNEIETKTSFFKVAYFNYPLFLSANVNNSVCGSKALKDK